MRRPVEADNCDGHEPVAWMRAGADARMAQPSYEQLREENEQLRRRIAQLQEEMDRLKALVEEAQRKAKRQAAPFSKGQPKANPKKPGRRKGKAYGRRGHRPAPKPDQIDEVYEVEFPSACPHCTGTVEHTRVDQQYQVEIPRRPIHRQFNVHIGHCTDCGCRVQGRHPLQTSDALGAAAVQLGSELQAGIVDLNKTAGLSHGKIQQSLANLFGIDVSRSTVCRVMLRVSGRVEPLYDKIVATLPAQAAVSPDETGWRIGGHRAWLHTFATPILTSYTIARSRGGEVAEAMLGLTYTGTLIHDGWAAYDRFLNAEHQQCLAHLLKRCNDLSETATAGAVRFPRQVKAILQQGLDVRDRYHAGQISDHGLAVARGHLESRLDQLLVWPKTNPANDRFARHLARHQDEIFTFLHDPTIDATNWRGEQAIRPAVVNRKVWGGNRTDAGAKAQSTLMTVLRTCTQQGRNVISFLGAWIRGEWVGLDGIPAGP